MMRVSCPSCLRILTVPVEAAGQAGTCPNCGQRLKVGRGTVLAVPYKPNQTTTVEGTEKETAIQPPAAVPIPSVSVAPETTRWPLRTLLVAGVVLIVGLLAIGAGMGYMLAGGRTSAEKDESRSAPPVGDKPSFSRSAVSVLFERKDLEAKLSQATPERVRRLLGDPADIGQPAFGLNADRLGWNEPGVDLWMYHKKTRNPETGKPDPDLLVWFKWGRVSLVVCQPIEGIKNDTNGLENLTPQWQK